MFTYFLALACLTNLGTVQPEVISAHKDKESCEIAALKINHIRTEEHKKAGLAAVCLKLDGPEA